MPTTTQKHLDSSESMRVTGPADIKIKRGQRESLGENDKEGMQDLQDKVGSTWETLQTQGGKVLQDVQKRGSDLIENVKEKTDRSGLKDDNVGEWQEVSYRGKKRGNKEKQEELDVLPAGQGQISKSRSLDDAKNRLARMVNTERFTWQDALAYLVPLVILALALTAGIAAYRAYTAPAPLPPANTLEGMRARANLWGTQAYDYMADKADFSHHYATEKAALLSEQLKGKAGIFSDKTKEQVWKARDSAAEQANAAYKDALKKAEEARQLADKRSHEALKDLRSYMKKQTQPMTFTDKIKFRINEWKDMVLRKVGLVGEDARHKKNLAAEQMRHKAEKTKLEAQTNTVGDKIKNTINDVKENVKAKIHPHL